MMQALIQFLGRPLRKSVQWYLSKPRQFNYKGISMIIHPGVFHPGFFFSTKLIVEFLEKQNLTGENFLELGSGSGLISIYASKKNAHVTAVDINKRAVANTLENSRLNNTKIRAFESDLFSNVQPTVFDWIVINPPYYPADPKTDADHAWNCGKNHQYFENLFASLGGFTTKKSNVLMILSDVCDLKTIFQIASAHHFGFEKILEKKVWADGQNHLYWVKKIKDWDEVPHTVNKHNVYK